MALYDPAELGRVGFAEQALIPSEPSRVAPSRPVGFDPSRNDVADKLARSRELIERGWCQNAKARDAAGNEVLRVNDPSAVSFCVYGALLRVSGDDTLDWSLTIPLAKATGHEFLANWNDTNGRTQAEVVEAFRKAEAIARGEA